MDMPGLSNRINVIQMHFPKYETKIMTSLYFNCPLSPPPPPLLKEKILSVERKKRTNRTQKKKQAFFYKSSFSSFFRNESESCVYSVAVGFGHSLL